MAGLDTLGLLLLGGYLLYYTGYELVLVVFLVDTYHGALESWPWFTVTVLFLTILVDLVKPLVLLYTDKNEILS